MQAAVVNDLGQTPRYQSFPDPEPAESEALIHVRAAGLHPAVKALASGRLYAGTAEIFDAIPTLFSLALTGDLTVEIEPAPLRSVESAWTRNAGSRRIVFTM